MVFMIGMLAFMAMKLATAAKVLKMPVAVLAPPSANQVLIMVTPTMMIIA